ncbi:hypothetical protein [Streptomyces sp. NPDC050164]|uniref:hypothetical protein n=1 Tax=Streptomyces sp. NPDC050164 TaxID=3365605 RepID=UPI00378DC6F2
MHAPCTLDQLEAATKKGAVGADVEMKNGTATLVTERRAAQQEAGSGSSSCETVVEASTRARESAQRHRDHPPRRPLSRMTPARTMAA